MIAHEYTIRIVGGTPEGQAKVLDSLDHYIGESVLDHLWDFCALGGKDKLASTGCDYVVEAKCVYHPALGRA